jgi:uncharacterized protein with PQ loop repeat
MSHSLQKAKTKKQTSKIKLSNTLNKLVLAVGIIEPLITIPQAYTVWVDKQTAGVSLLTWTGYIVAAIIWVLYGLKIKDKPIIISSAMWVLIEAAVVLGVLIR